MLLLLRLTIQCQSQTIENKGIHYGNGVMQTPLYHIQYTISSSTSGVHFSHKSMLFSMGQLQPVIMYSPDKKIIDEMIQLCKIGPNPVHDCIVIQMNAPQIIMHSISIIDIYGHNIFKENYNQVCIGFFKQIHINNQYSRILILTIDFEWLSYSPLHFTKQFKLIQYD